MVLVPLDLARHILQHFVFSGTLQVSKKALSKAEDPNVLLDPHSLDVLSMI